MKFTGKLPPLHVCVLAYVYLDLDSMILLTALRSHVLESVEYEAS